MDARGKADREDAFLRYRKMRRNGMMQNGKISARDDHCRNRQIAKPARTDMEYEMTSTEAAASRSDAAEPAQQLHRAKLRRPSLPPGVLI